MYVTFLYNFYVLISGQKKIIQNGYIGYEDGSTGRIVFKSWIVCVIFNVLFTLLLLSLYWLGMKLVVV